MNHRPLKTAVAISTIIMGLASLFPANAEVDAMQLRLLEPYKQDLRWDNIESAPEWLNGVEPEYHKGWHMHRVVLAPRQQTTFMLPAYESVRLYHPDQTLTGQELDVFVSDGSGLAEKQTMQQSTDGHSLVLSPNSASPLLVHINRPYQQSGGFAIALFVSRKVPINDIAPYRNLVWSSAPWCLLGQEPFVLPELYHQLPARQAHRFDITGPARLLLKNRLHYGRNASELIQDYRIRYWLDEGNAQELKFSTSVETSRIITVNTAIEVAGREQQAYLEIPDGQHKLMLQSDRDLYIQAVAQTEHDYLFRSLNNPRLPVEDIRKQGLLPTTDLMRQEQIARRLAEDNSRQAGGMAASNLLRNAALQRPDYPPGLTAAEELAGFRTFYRDLLPSKKIAGHAQFMAYFLGQTLPAVNRPQSNAIVADQHLTEALKRVGNAYFTALPDAGSTAANEYTLPAQATAGVARLIVDERGCRQRLLRIQIDQQAPKDLWLRCGAERNPETFVRSLAETALIRLQQETDAFNVSLEPLFAAHFQAAKLVPTAVYELPIPQTARTIRVWQASERLATPVHVALQYRAAKPFLLSEHSYMERLRDLAGKRIIIDPARLSAKLPTSPLSSDQEFLNEWLPLQRLLQNEYHLYTAGVNAAPEKPAYSPVAKQTLAEEMALATASENQQHWLEALEHWGKVANHATGLAREQAQLAQAQALGKLGETYLAESLYKYLTLYAEGPAAEQAIQKLSAHYQAQQDMAALQTLAAAMVVRRPGIAHTRLLLDALLQNGEYRFVLLVGYTFIGQPAPAEAMLVAAYQLGWWETYQWFQDQLPPAQRAFWVGLKAQLQGDYGTALQAWSESNLKPWYDHLQQGLVLRDRLKQINQQTAPALYSQWAQWQQRYPGAKNWQNALWHVTDYAGGDNYYTIERDVYGQAVRATAQRPVKLAILGPATLNLQFRPLHPHGRADSAIDGWLQIADNQDEYRFPYTNNLPAQGLALTGADNLQPGNQVGLIYHVGQGWHELQLNSGQAPLSISIQEQRPAMPLSVLPPLQADTVAEMGFISRWHQWHPTNTTVFNNIGLWH